MGSSRVETAHDDRPLLRLVLPQDVEISNIGDKLHALARKAPHLIFAVESLVDFFLRTVE